MVPSGLLCPVCHANVAGPTDTTASSRGPASVAFSPPLPPPAPLPPRPLADETPPWGPRLDGWLALATLLVGVFFNLPLCDPPDRRGPFGSPAFFFGATEGPLPFYGPRVLWFGLAAASAVALRTAARGRFHRRREREYDEAVRAHVERASQAKAAFDRARAFARGGDAARALLALGDALRLEPAYPEAAALREELQVGAAPSERRVSAVLSLRVVGTPYAYEAPLDAPSVSVGRQRRGPNRDPAVGNDFVVRVPGDDARSLNISRRHFEIERIGMNYFVTDKSKKGLTLNGRRLPAGARAPLASGDRLVVAEVLIVEALIRPALHPGQRQRSVTLAGDRRQNGIILEASVGDMVTL